MITNILKSILLDTLLSGFALFLRKIASNHNLTVKTALPALLVLAMSAPSKADDVQLYQGFFDGGAAMSIILIWKESGEVSGEMFGDHGNIPLQGTNPTEGVLDLLDDMGGRYNLTKTTTDDRIVWRGLFEGRFPLEFSRPR